DAANLFYRIILAHDFLHDSSRSGSAERQAQARTAVRYARPATLYSNAGLRFLRRAAALSLPIGAQLMRHDGQPGSQNQVRKRTLRKLRDRLGMKATFQYGHARLLGVQVEAPLPSDVRMPFSSRRHRRSTTATPDA